MFHRQGLGGKLEADLSEFVDAREVVAALSEEYAAAESSDYVRTALYCNAAAWAAEASWAVACCYLGCRGLLCSGMLLPGLLPQQCAARCKAANSVAAAFPAMCLTPPTFPRPPPPPQIDRADGSAADLATQLASQMNLGAAGGLGDPRAPLRA